MRPHRVHDRRPRRNRATAQVVAVGEAAGHDDKIRAGGKLAVGMPDHRWRRAGDEPDRARHVALTIDPGEDENGGFHDGTGPHNLSRVSIRPSRISSRTRMPWMLRKSPRSAF